MGEDPESPRPLVYIGQSESVFDRLKQQVVFFTSKDDNLTTSHVKYLESRFVTIAGEVGRVTLTNTQTPNLAVLPRSDRDAMEEFLEPTRLLLPALGFQLLQPIARKSGPDTTGPSGPLATTTLYFKMPKRGIEAKGNSTDEGFVVLAESKGGRILSSLTKSQRATRKRLIADGSVEEFGELGKDDEKPETPKSKQICFTRNVLFPSTSAAGSIVYGGSSNGRK
ncbi:MAG: GIY-YIG nuclease family protein, partial [Nannocystaceae bacterium]